MQCRKSLKKNFTQLEYFLDIKKMQYEKNNTSNTGL